MAAEAAEVTGLKLKGDSLGRKRGEATAALGSPLEQPLEQVLPPLPDYSMLSPNA